MIRRPPRSTLLSLHDALPIYALRRPDRAARLAVPDRRRDARDRPHGQLRSEEHTSELQSLAYLVCRLLLEKKKKTNTADRAWRENVKGRVQERDAGMSGSRRA